MRLILIILFLCLFLAGCGQKGPLFLPDADDPVEQHD
ncbi:MAG: lipoprotein [Gammaproteobacteria bacterium]|nr:lipoprotein [Gammaproteobacteria bacterium]